MKKFFSFVAALCVAVAASASVVWTESLDKNGTYIDKSGEQIWGTYWPYVNQWWEAGNMVHEYTSVTSYSCSIRGKKLNEDSQSTIGFYFGANKTADKCYFNLVNDKTPIYTAVEGDKLMFEIASPESGSAAEDIAAKLAVSINGTALTIPATVEVPAAASTATVEIELPAGAINDINVSMDNVATQKFIVNFRIEDAQTEGIENTMAEAKAVKVIRDGQVVIVRGNMEYNVLGTTVK